MLNSKIKSFTYNINPGLQLLRMILSFWIVLIHCSKINNITIRKILSTQLHVPTFLIMSFYFFYHNLFSRNIKKIKQRFQRLLIPYILYPIFIFIFDFLIFKLFSISRFNRKISLKELFLQFVFGINIHPIFWFQFDLLFFTLFFCIISFIFKKNFLLLLQVIMMYSYILQYSGITYYYFINYKKKHFRYIGSLVDIIPYTITGLTLNSLDLINKCKLNRIKNILLNILLLYLIIYFKIFNKPKGFRYQGISYNLGGISLFIIFSLIPFYKIRNKYLLSLIEIITNYTGGIYYMHDIIRDYLNKKIMIIKNKTFISGFLIYLISYFICFLGIKLFNRTKIKYLFY